MRPFYLILLVLGTAVSPLKAQWSKLENLSVTFRIKNAGLQVDGKFTSLTGQARLMEADLAASSFSGQVQAASISTGINLRDQHLRKGDYFDVEKFPSISMRSVQITPKEAGTYSVVWELTIKGQTRRFSSMVSAIERDQQLLLRSEFTINRRDWKVGGNSLTMSDQVKVLLTATMRK